MITRAQIERQAHISGFRSDILEKVVRLLAILRRLDDHEACSGRWVLKGGTALNLFHLEVPRLSVDIDLNFIGNVDAEALPAAREPFQQGLVACCERNGCTVRREPGEHAGGKFQLRFPSAFGGSQNLEVDVNYVMRVPLLGIERRKASVPGASEHVVSPTLTLEELAAGKFVALLSRSAARDHFDAANLLAAAPGLPRHPGFRIAFVCHAAVSRKDCRTLDASRAVLKSREVRQSLLPMLRVETAGPSPDPSLLAEKLRERVAPALVHLLKWSRREREFLDALLDEGSLESALLTDDVGLRERIARQPMLLWKQRHVKEFKSGRKAVR